MPAKPSSSIAHVEGSETPATGASDLTVTNAVFVQLVFEEAIGDRGDTLLGPRRPVVDEWDDHRAELKYPLHLNGVVLGPRNWLMSTS
jgi:hypothetical protein